MRAGELRRRLVDRLRRGSLWGEAGLLVGVTGVAQAVALFATPLLTRLYTPSDFGVLAVFMALLTVGFVIVTLRYDQAIVIPSASRDAAAVLIVSLVSVFVTSLVVLALLLGLRGPLGDMVGEPSLATWILLLPLALVGAGTYQTLVSWAVRERQVSLIGRTKVSQSTSQVGVQLAAGTLSAGPGGLLIGLVVGRAVGSARLARRLLRDDALRPWPRWTEARAAAVRFRRFPMLGAPAALCNSVAVELAPLILVARFGPITAGLFLAGNRMVGMPINLVGQSVSQVYSGRFGEALRTRPRDLAPLFRRSSRMLVVLGAVPAFVLLMAGPELMSLVLGEEWREAGVYARYLAPMFWAQLAVFPLEPSLGLLERQGVQLGRDAGRLIAVLGVFAVSGTLDWSAGTTVAAYGAVLTVAYVVIYVLARREVMRAASGDVEHALEGDPGLMGRGGVDGDVVDHPALDEVLQHPAQVSRVDAEHRRAGTDQRIE